MLLLISGLLPAFAGPSAEQLSADWAKHQDVRRAQAQIQVELSAEDMSTLAQGDAVRRIVPTGEAATVVGVAWIPAKPVHVWVAIQDVVDRPLNKDQAVTKRLPQDTLTRRMNYNLIDAPWPIVDRQSVCSVTANTPLWEATDKAVWERSLKLEDPSLAVEPDPEAMWITRLGGGFHIVEASGGSIVVFQIDADPGGSLPADLVNRFAWLGLNSTMETLTDYAVEVPTHYAGSHPLVALPDGTMIPPGTL